ncbi:hypothetical protein LSH36_951g00036 [Paralvinella palmiformis]|uniref:Uncharacterized protein n=1 Tax=Paralvinella palmiformis TaxID=53620 RepID=A0AAD9IYL0_9ANNE|nr:hypothetical protein LSH36_951g00036 [Paralvinella palmiformis]
MTQLASVTLYSDERKMTSGDMLLYIVIKASKVTRWRYWDGRICHLAQCDVVILIDIALSAQPIWSGCSKETFLILMALLDVRHSLSLMPHLTMRRSLILMAQPTSEYVYNDEKEGKYNCVHKALVRVALHGDKNVKDRVDDDFTSKQYVDPANDDNGT